MGFGLWVMGGRWGYTTIPKFWIVWSWFVQKAWAKSNRVSSQQTVTKYLQMNVNFDNCYPNVSSISLNAVNWAKLSKQKELFPWSKYSTPTAHFLIYKCPFNILRRLFGVKKVFKKSGFSILKVSPKHVHCKTSQKKIGSQMTEVIWVIIRLIRNYSEPVIWSGSLDFNEKTIARF